jgi:hypothetical protein
VVSRTLRPIPPNWPEKHSRYLPNRRLSIHQSMSERFKKEKNLLLPLRFEPLIVQSAAQSLHQLCHLFHGETAPGRPGRPHRCLTIPLRHTTLGRTPLDERSARPRDLYLTTHNTTNIPCALRNSNPSSGICTIHAIHLRNFRSGNNVYK